MNINNIYSARFATFNDVGTMVLNDGSEKYIKSMSNSIESIILVFRAYGNYKDWLKCSGFNDNLNSWKCFYNLVLSCDWKNEDDKNIATAKNLLEFHIKHPVFYTKMINIK